MSYRKQYLFYEKKNFASQNNDFINKQMRIYFIKSIFLEKNIIFS